MSWVIERGLYHGYHGCGRSFKSEVAGEIVCQVQSDALLLAVYSRTIIPTLFSLALSQAA
jgi:hypothetical protein